MSQTVLIPTIVGAFVVLFPLLWVGVVTLISRIAGWSRLAADHGRPSGEPDVRFRLCSGKLGWANYNGVLNLAAGPGGLDLSTMWLFGAGHTPFRVSWKDLEIRRESGFLFDTAVLEFRRSPGTRLQISRRLGDHLVKASGGALVYAGDSPA